MRMGLISEHLYDYIYIRQDIKCEKSTWAAGVVARLHDIQSIRSISILLNH